MKCVASCLTTACPFHTQLPKIDHGLDHMSPMEVLTMKTKGWYRPACGITSNR